MLQFQRITEYFESRNVIYKTLNWLEFKENFSRVSSHFWIRDSISVDCKHTSEIKARKSFSLNLFDYQDIKCKNFVGSLSINRPGAMPSIPFHGLPAFASSIFIVKPRITTTEESLRRFSSKDRNCYFDDERKLKYFEKYTRNNCEEECLSNLFLELCQCVAFYHIREFLIGQKLKIH